ncbi:hypothetical protein AVEN_194761-1 [Araneus ventricosus]|uniref:Uncharacterized protein n=1 Tax=Araneus ventricosus TaxID=182803 RepID=A0A4Y2B4V5_ARAVE|nr:hypothetical protein AVEN_194761-1 [Araneus ventricosus]
MTGRGSGSGKEKEAKYRSGVDRSRRKCLPPRPQTKHAPLPLMGSGDFFVMSSGALMLDVLHLSRRGACMPFAEIVLCIHSLGGSLPDRSRRFPVCYTFQLVIGIGDQLGKN